MIFVIGLGFIALAIIIAWLSIIPIFLNKVELAVNMMMSALCCVGIGLALFIGNSIYQTVGYLLP